MTDPDSNNDEKLPSENSGQNCGDLIPSATAPVLPSAVVSHGPTPDAAELLTAGVTPEQETPPYAIFAAQVLGSAVLGSIAVFNIAHDSARGQWHSTPSTVIATGLALVLLQRAPGGWNKIGELDQENGQVLRRNLLIRSIVFALLFLGAAAIVGFEIGKSGRESAQMTADFEKMSQVGRRISLARNGAAHTIPANIDMYRSIETDVQELDAILRRLRTELDVYDAKFPDQHEGTTKSMAAIELGIRRLALLKQQIAVAKEIDTIPPAAQWKDWQARMQPLLQEEGDLDRPK